MMNLREQPLRLERALTQDYINRAVKMREIEERIARDREHPIWAVVYWIVLVAVLGGWIYLNL